MTVVSSGSAALGAAGGEGVPERDRGERRPRILVVRRRYLGDTVLTEPFFRNLRERWPRAWLALVVDTPYLDALSACPDVDEIIEVPTGPLGLRTSLGRWARSLRSVAGRGPWDLAFDLARNERAHAFLVASRARRRVALAIDTPPARAWLYTDLVPVSKGDVDRTHSVDISNRLLRAVGIPTPHRVPTVPVPDEDVSAAREALTRASVPADGPGPVILLHPGSGSDARRWPAVAFARVADRLVEETEARVLVLSGPAEPGLGRAVLDAMRRPAALLAQAPGVRVLFALLARADVLLCNDSGPMHMAAAVGTPVCAVFGSQSTATWAPLGGAGHLVFQAPLPCGTACVAPAECDPGDPMKSFCVRRIRADDVADSLVHRLTQPHDDRGRATAG